jgi:hypothetical protein
MFFLHRLSPWGQTRDDVLEGMSTRGSLSRVWIAIALPRVCRLPRHAAPKVNMYTPLGFVCDKPDGWIMQFLYIKIADDQDDFSHYTLFHHPSRVSSSSPPARGILLACSINFYLNN